MASRFFRFGAKHWRTQASKQTPHLGALWAGGLACGLGEVSRIGRAEENLDVHASTAADLKAHHLSSWSAEGFGLVNEREVNKFINPMVQDWPNMNFLNPNELVMGHIIKHDSKIKSRDEALKDGCVRGNACKEIWWDPKTVRAAIVTCGGLCPGLNSIIREVTNSLCHAYGVQEVIGIQSGYNGLSDPLLNPPVKLTPQSVREIHMKGGSVLKAGRGGFEPEVICDNLQKLGINMLFVVGGDGTQSAGHLLYETAKKRNMPISIVGVPKSIDNDVVIFDKTFGFDSACAAAAEVIRNAWVEATSCEKGVGIVKLMGRDAGFVAMNASLSSTIVDLCLIPEVSWKMTDVFDHVDNTLSRKNYMVITVAEGAGQEYVNTGEKDSTGHTKYGDIGCHLRDELNKHLKASGGRSFYIDPSYIIRSVPIRPNDHIFCGRLARDAVHTAMRGYTGVCVGSLHNIIVIMPSHLIAGKKKRVKLTSSAWQSCVQVCKMPRSLSGQ